VTLSIAYSKVGMQQDDTGAMLLPGEKLEMAEVSSY